MADTDQTPTTTPEDSLEADQLDTVAGGSMEAQIAPKID